MKLSVKIVIFICLACLLVAAGILQWNWYHVDGSEIAFLNAIPADCTGKVTVQSWNQQRWEQEMTGAQIQQLLDLLRNSSYEKETDNPYSGSWDTTYWVFLDYTLNGQPQHLFLQICGDEAIHFSGPVATPSFLLIVEREGWQAALDAIFPAP